jgi:hypothetical protein
MLAYAFYKIDANVPVNFWLFLALSNIFYSLSNYDLLNKTHLCLKFSTQQTEDGVCYLLNRSLFQVCTYSLLATLF